MLNKLNENFAQNGKVQFTESSEGFILMEINNKLAKARISLYGGQLLEFQPHSQSEPVLWISKNAVYKRDKAIRGGVPICWPWFGKLKTAADIKLPAHGFARLSTWKVKSITELDDKSTEIILKMPCESICEQYQTMQNGFEVKLSLRIVVGEQLIMELNTKNAGKYPVRISEALHSYFYVSDINEVVIKGLDNTDYIDKLLNMRAFRQGGDIALTTETDRIYTNTSSSISIVDNQLKREIIICKTNSMSTVIWNPWEDNSKTMSDMPDKGWCSMLCVEAANVVENEVLVQAGELHTMGMQISIEGGS